jgi:hypothetical protein
VEPDPRKGFFKKLIKYFLTLEIKSKKEKNIY